MTEVLDHMVESFETPKIVIAVNICKLVIFMLGAGHVIGCLWYAFGVVGDRNWVIEYNYTDRGLLERYTISLRWALSQFAGGMDEVTPVSSLENIYSIFIFILTFWVGAVFLSILTSSMTQMYILSSNKKVQISLLKRFLSQHRISKRLALRVTRNAKHALEEQQKMMPEKDVELAALVSEPLLIEMHFEMYMPVLGSHPFFERYMTECPHVMRRVCHYAMSSSMRFHPGDVIFHCGQHCWSSVAERRPSFNAGGVEASPIRCEEMDSTGMLAVRLGTLEYIDADGSSMEVHAGQFISEAALWVPWVHQGMLRATADCQLCALNARTFQDIIGQFEHSDFDPREYACEFVDRLNEYPERVSDLTPPGQWNLRRSHAQIFEEED